MFDIPFTIPSNLSMFLGRFWSSAHSLAAFFLSALTEAEETEATEDLEAAAEEEDLAAALVTE